MKHFFYLALLYSPVAFALVCGIESETDFENLNMITIKDEDIVTAEDLMFCQGSQKNSNIGPHSLIDDGSIWRAGNRRWSEEWEKKYSDWVAKEVTADFFKTYNITTDCADAALAIRAIFSRIHHLPVAFSGGNFKYTDKKWKNLPTVKNWDEKNWKSALKSDMRFRAALDAWKNGIGTANMHLDTFPLKLRDQSDTTKMAECVRPGAVLLSEAHTRFMVGMDSMKWNPIQQMSSTVPSKVRILEKSSLSLSAPTINTVFPGRGILGWNWPVYCEGKLQLIPDSMMPYYSKEQYDFAALYPDKEFKEVMEDLARTKSAENPKKEDIDQLIEELKNKVTSRVTIVNQGLNAYHANPQDDAHFYENFSTPNLDKALIEHYQLINFLVERYQGKIGMNQGDLINRLSETKIEIAPNKKLSLFQFLSSLAEHRISHHPADSLELRWGLDYIKELKSDFSDEKAESLQLQQSLKEIQKNLKEEQASLQTKENLSFKAYAALAVSPGLQLLSSPALKLFSSYSLERKRIEDDLAATNTRLASEVNYLKSLEMMIAE